MSDLQRFLLSCGAIFGVAGGYLFHPALYLVGVPLWMGIVIDELKKSK